MLNPRKILLIEDDSVDAETIERMLQRNSSETSITHAKTVSEAVECIRRCRFDAIISDLSLPDSRDLNTVSRLLEAAPAAPIIVLTGSNEEVGAELIRSGANDFLQKGTIDSLLLRTINFSIERYKLKRDLMRANSVLAGQNRSLVAHCEASRTFVDNVSHEFRTPLTVVREYASILRDGIDGPVNEKQISRIDTLISRTEDLSRMVDDLLDTSKLGMGLVRVFATENRLIDLVRNVVQLVESRAKANGVEVRIGDFDSETRVFCDEEKLRRILTNLLTNAVKFTSSGGKIDVNAKQDGEFIAISVTDTGIGIAPEFLHQIFERFEQVADHTRTSTTKGFGLGLSIARALAEISLGKLEVTSTEGEGSTFTVFIPQAKTESILKCYFDKREVAKKEHGTISLINIRAESAEGQTEQEETPKDRIRLDQIRLDRINGLISSHLTNMDLSLRTAPDQWTIFLANRIDLPKQLIEKIEDSLANLKASSKTGTFPKLQFEVLGEFQLKNDRETLERLGKNDPSAPPCC